MVQMIKGMNPLVDTRSGNITLNRVIQKFTVGGLMNLNSQFEDLRIRSGCQGR